MTQYIRRMRVALCTAFVATALIAAGAQDATSGSISGTITDSSGAAIKGATVTVTNTDRNHVERTVVTNGAGFYTATALPLGHYSVQITDQGFKASSVTGLELHVNDAITVNRSLPAGSTSETVTVTAETLGINLQDATSSGLINSEQINEMPLVTRNYETLMNLQPGVVFGGATDDLTRGPSGLSGASSTVNFSVNGGRNTSEQLDDRRRGQCGPRARTSRSTPTPALTPSPSSRRCAASTAPQFGRNASGQVDVVTKSGTNLIHGSAYEYLRNDASTPTATLTTSSARTSHPTATTSSASRSAARFISQRSTTARTRPSSSCQKSGSALFSMLPQTHGSCSAGLRACGRLLAVRPEDRRHLAARASNSLHGLHHQPGDPGEYLHGHRHAGVEPLTHCHSST